MDWHGILHPHMKSIYAEHAERGTTDVTLTCRHPEIGCYPLRSERLSPLGQKLQIRIRPNSCLCVKGYDEPGDSPTHRIICQADASAVGFYKCLANCEPETEALS